MKKGFKKTVLPLLLSISMVMISFTGTSYATEGWTKADGAWSYLNKNGQPVKNAWRKSRGNSFYLDSSGTIKTDSIFELDGSIYGLAKDGAMIREGWLYGVNEENPDGGAAWYYFGSDGTALKKKTKKFKWTIGDKYYVFDEEGRMLSNCFIDSEGNVVDNEDPFVEGIYYAGEDGALFADKWLPYEDGVYSSDMHSSLVDAYYTEYDTMWLYFGNDGKKAYSKKADELSEREIGGVVYGFDENGIMSAWWGSVASVSDAEKNRPMTDDPIKFYSEYDGGKLMKNKWFWMYPSEELDARDFDEQECSWFYANSVGEAIKNRIYQVNNKYYAFDGIGRMQTGFVVFDGKDNFVAQYDIDAWDSEAFINGDMPGIDRGDLYLFSPDELNDGSMETGKNIKVELDDGVHTFGFAPNGKAYGSRDKLQRKVDSFYKNGLRLDGDEGYGYGIVKDTDGSYKVVDVNGKIIEGKKRIIRDNYDGYILIINNNFAAYVKDDYAPRWRTGDKIITGYYHYNKDVADHYRDGLIAAPGSDPDTGSIPGEMRINF